jgi:predicted GNAT family N-acyltransferase
LTDGVEKFYCSFFLFGSLIRQDISNSILLTVPLPTTTFRTIKFGSADFQKECELRNEVLRLPLGLNLCNEDIEQERTQMHFGLFDQNDELLACAIALPYSSYEAKIRQMAVQAKHVGQGHGKNIIRLLEDYLARQGFTFLFMHARITAAGFYEKLGYIRSGDEFAEVGIKHIRMEKQIQTRM